jgi:hypothetical protein
VLRLVTYTNLTSSSCNTTNVTLQLDVVIFDDPMRHTDWSKSFEVSYDFWCGAYAEPGGLDRLNAVSALMRVCAYVCDCVCVYV